MHQDNHALRVPSVPPTKTYFGIVLPMVLGEFAASMILHPSRWMLNVILTLALTAVLVVFWYCVFMPRHSARIYVVSALGLEIENAGRCECRIPASDIVAAISIGPAVKVERRDGKPVMIYPGNRADEIIMAIPTTQTTEQVGASNP